MSFKNFVENICFTRLVPGNWSKPTNYHCLLHLRQVAGKNKAVVRVLLATDYFLSLRNAGV